MLRSKFILMTLVIVSGLLGLLRFDSLQLGTSYDDAHYIILAESLSSGQGYQLINFPRPQVERAFPPGWPVLLVPLTLIFPGQYAVLKVFSLLLWLASIFLIYNFFSKRLSSPHLEMVTGLAALNPLLIGSSVTVMSETAYLFFSMLALVLFDKRTDGSGRTKTWLLVMAVFFAFYAVLIRTIGISLILSLVLFLLITRQFREVWKVVLIFAAGFLFLGWFNAQNGGAVVSSGYEAQVLNGSVWEKVGQVWSNATGYANETLAGSLLPVFGTGVDKILGKVGLQFVSSISNGLVLLLLLFGFFIWKPKLDWMHLYVVIYMLGVLAFWNPNVGSVKARFLIPILPFLYFYLLQGIAWTAEKAHKNRIKYGRRLEAFFIGLIALVLLIRNGLDWRNPVMQQMTDLSVGTSWIAENAPLDSIVMVNEPVPAYVHVQRKTIGYPTNGQELERYLDNQGIDYIVVSPKLQSPRSAELDRFTIEQVLPVLTTRTDRFKLVFMDEEYNVMVYEYAGGR